MIFKRIETEGADLDLLNSHVNNGKHAFIFLFMDGCGHCEDALPKWKQIENDMGDEYKDNDDVMVAAVNKEVLGSMPYVEGVNGFPTIKYIFQGNNKKRNEDYEDSSIVTKDRSTSSFINWIENSIKRFESVKPVEISLNARGTKKRSKRSKQSKRNKKRQTQQKRKRNKRFKKSR